VGRAVFTRLADLLLVQAIRGHLADAVLGGWPEQGQPPDPRIEQAAALIRDQLARPWTLQALARKVVTGRLPGQRPARQRTFRSTGGLQPFSSNVVRAEFLIYGVLTSARRRVVVPRMVVRVIARKGSVPRQLSGARTPTFRDPHASSPAYGNLI
jgi:hypothetical protein